MNLKVSLIVFLTKCSLIFAALTNYWERSMYQSKELAQFRIVGGQDAVPHSHPYLVSLQIRLFWMRTHICGGTILNKNWVLTAGHCVKESFLIRWLPMDAVVGAHDVDHFAPQTQVVSIDKRISHPLYKGGIGPHDIAVLKLSSPFYFTKEVQPVKLPIDVKENPDYLQLTGWGNLKTTLFFPALPEKLQEVNVTYIPYDECHSAIEKIKDDDEDNPLDKRANICTGPLSGGIAGCSGDSGGPLVQFMTGKKYYANDEVNDVTEDYLDYDENGDQITYNDERVPVVLGVVSWGVMPCGRKGAPTVYSKVSNYLDFIYENIKN